MEIDFHVEEWRGRGPKDCELRELKARGPGPQGVVGAKVDEKANLGCRLWTNEAGGPVWKGGWECEVSVVEQVKEGVC